MHKRISILGGGESGLGAALLAQQQGAEVFLSERGVLTTAVRAQLDAQAIAWEDGRHTQARILDADILVKSPGIPGDIPLVQAAREAGIEVISEIELAARYSHRQVIAVTGTNGKSTTASLIYSMLKDAGYDVALCGNIGTSWARQLVEDPAEWYVVEVSSFQLDDVVEFRPYIAVILNITDNHLNRYGGSVEAYALAKMNITARQTADDHLIHCLDSPTLAWALKQSNPQAQLHGFAAQAQPEAEAWLADNSIQIAMAKDKKKKASFQIALEKQKLKGKHNAYNSMASAIVGRVLEIRNENIRESLMNFESLEHRLEEVQVIAGVTYVNDSKATSVNAAWYALDSINGSIVWILGGVDKGNDYGMLLDIVKAKVSGIVMLGEDVEKIQKAFTKVVDRMEHATSMSEAVQKAASLAEEGSTVLLSPACASFDMFDNYEARGRAFKRAVADLED